MCKSCQHHAAGSRRRAGQLTGYGNSNISIAGHIRLRRLCLSFCLRPLDALAMKTRTLTRKEVAAEPHRVWNATNRCLSQLHEPAAEPSFQRIAFGGG